MKLTQQLLSISEESAVAKSAQQQADLLKAHQKAKKVSADQGVVQHVNKDKNTGRIYASDWYDDVETLASYNNGKLKEDIAEASNLNDVTIDDMKDEKEPGANKKADEMEVGDAVKIVGGVEHDGEKGHIERFGHEKKFVVVKFKDGSMNSFHSSDVEELLGGEEDEDDDDSYDEDPDTFYVAFYDEDEHHSWIGKVTKADGGKWHEEKYQGKPDYRWGTSYMSYLKPQDVMNWIHKDYRRGMEIEGPFFTPAEAIEYAEHNWGSIKESVDMNEAQAYTDFEDWKAAVLHSYPQQAKKIKFKGRMEGGKDTISAEVPGEDRSYGVWDQDEEKGVVLSEGAASAIVAAAKKIGKWLLQPVTAVSDKNIEEYVNAVEELKAMKEQRMWAGLMARLTDEQLDRAKLLSNPAVKKAAKAEIANRLKGVFEAVKPAELKKAQAYFNRNADADMDYEDIINMLTSEDFSEEVAHDIAINAGRKAPKKQVTEAAKDTIEAYGIKGMKRTPWRRSFKDAEALNDWCEKMDAEVHGQRETDYAEQLRKGKNVEEGVVDSVKGFVKHQSNMSKANSRGWATFGKGFRTAVADRYETDPEKKAENEKVVKQSVRDANRYRDFADDGKGFSSTKRTTAEKEWDDKVDKAKGAVKGAVKTIQRTVFNRDVKEGAANDRLQARAKELLPVLKGPFKKKESVVAQCAKLAAKYWNDAGLQKAHDIDDYITSEMKKRGITEGVEAALAETAVRKGSVAYNIAMKRKEEENKPANIKKTEKIGDRNHMVGNAKVSHDMTGEKCTKTGCKGHFKETSMNDDMDGKLHCDKCGKETKRYVSEGFSPFKPNARVKIISGPKDCIGKEGTIGEVVTTNGQKSYTVDYDHDFQSDKPNFGAKSVRLQPKDIKLIRDTKVKEAKGDGEQLEVINKAHADNGAPKKVFFTGNREECYAFMRSHKSLKMDLMYKESGRLASYVL